MADITVFEELFDTKILALLKIFIKNTEKQFYLREISKLSGIPPATTYRILKKLSSLGIIRLVQIRSLKLYQLEDNKKTAMLKQALIGEMKALEYFIEKAKAFSGIREIILQGREKDEKANMILIGEGLPAQDIKRLCQEVKEKYRFTVSAISLSQEQYEQMSAMGLFGGEKKTLIRI